MSNAITNKILKILAANRKWIGYSVYGIILMFVLLIYRFPSDALKEYVQTAINSRAPNLSVTIQKAALSFPFHLKFTEVECRMKEDPSTTVFKTKEILVKPSFWSLFTKNQAYRFSCSAYEGAITGTVNLGKNDETAQYNSSVEFKNINVNDKSPLPSFIKKFLDGTLDGTIKYSGSGFGDPAGSGEASLTVSNGSVNLGTPILDIKAIDFKEVLIKADLKAQTLNIPSLSLKGDNFLGQGSGAITLKNPITKSLINFNASIEPTTSSVRKTTNRSNAMALLTQSLKNGKISFILQGTIEQPVFRLK
jgi:type II secretion system protein N